MNATAAFRRIVTLLSGSDQTLYADDILKVENALRDAAAPDLAEALEKLLHWVEDMHNPRTRTMINFSGMDEARAALAKARGEE